MWKKKSKSMLEKKAFLSSWELGKRQEASGQYFEGEKKRYFSRKKQEIADRERAAAEV